MISKGSPAVSTNNQNLSDKLPIAAIQLCSTDNLDENLQRAEIAIEKSVARGAKVVALPECFALMPSRHQQRIDHVESYGHGKVQDWMRRVSHHWGIWLVGGTHSIRSDDPQRPYAACMIYNPQGERVCRYDKIHLFDANFSEKQERFKESSYTTPGYQSQVFDTPYGKMGVIICYDVRFPELIRKMAEENITFLFVPSAFAVTSGQAHWETLLRCRAIENQCFVVAPGQCGLHYKERRSYGHSMIIDPWGRVLIQGENEPTELVVTCDLSLIDWAESQLPVKSHRRFSLKKLTFMQKNH